MEKKKEIIFISHAVPADNYLAVWLASKLKLLGYNVWVDKDDLRSGSAFWNEIELSMRHDSVRFLALVSDPYIEKALNKDTGVFSEISLAKILSKKIKNFIIPIKVDNCNYDDFPINILPLNSIEFNNNWGAGLKELVSELEIQQIPNNHFEENTLSLWHQCQNICGTPIQKNDEYSSNWLSSSLPLNLSVCQYQGDTRKIQKSIPFPSIRDKDLIIGFFEESHLIVNPNYYEKISVQDFIYSNELRLANDIIIKDTESKLTYLMNNAIDNYFYLNEAIKCYRKNNKSRIFYTTKPPMKSGYFPFEHKGRKSRRKLKGFYKPVYWNFGLSFIFQLHPFPHYVLNYHLLCSDSTGFIHDDRKYRRAIPSGWFNLDWFDKIIAFMNYANNCKNEDILKFEVGNEFITLDLNTIQFTSDYGYTET